MDALRLTVPMLDEIDIAKWPFNRTEFDILSGIGNAYLNIDKKDIKLEFLLKLKENVERKYMDVAHYVVWHMRALSGLSQMMCITKKYGESLEYCKIGLEECKKWNILGGMSDFLYDVAWSRERLIEEDALMIDKSVNGQELSVKKERAFCKEQLVQAYFLSLAQGDLHGAERARKLYEKFYPSEIKLP